MSLTARPILRGHLYDSVYVFWSFSISFNPKICGWFLLPQPCTVHTNVITPDRNVLSTKCKYCTNLQSYLLYSPTPRMFLNSFIYPHCFLVLLPHYLFQGRSFYLRNISYTFKIPSTFTLYVLRFVSMIIMKPFNNWFWRHCRLACCFESDHFESFFLKPWLMLRKLLTAYTFFGRVCVLSVVS
jgi:hypothetical protein